METKKAIRKYTIKRELKAFGKLTLAALILGILVTVIGDGAFDVKSIILSALSIIAIVVGLILAVKAVFLLGYIASILAFGWDRGKSFAKDRRSNAIAMSFLLLLPMLISIVAFKTKWPENAAALFLMFAPLVVLLVLRLRTPFARLSVTNPHTYNNRSWLKKNGYWDMAVEFARTASQIKPNRDDGEFFRQLHPLVLLGDEMFAIIYKQHSIAVYPYRNMMRLYKEHRTISVRRMGKINESDWLVLQYKDGEKVSLPQPCDSDIIAIIQRVLYVSPDLQVGAK